MWIYAHSLSHYVKVTQTLTTVDSLTGGIKECKTCRRFFALPGRISPCKNRFLSVQAHLYQLECLGKLREVLTFC